MGKTRQRKKGFNPPEFKDPKHSGKLRGKRDEQRAEELERERAAYMASDLGNPSASGDELWTGGL